MTSSLYLLDSDAASLRHRVDILASDPHSRRALQGLRAELARASVLPLSEFPADVVRIGSQIDVLDLTDGETARYVLCFPEHAEIAAGRLSVFAPLGTALLGFPAGHEFTWEMPGGRRRLRILAVVPPAAPSPGPQSAILSNLRLAGHS
ncbi:MAG: GreA/GreB family elongation factor [Opitutaceae bacterium]|jgi:regulator of nucleoside diphosphate kinase|nr:GreA/GreB family elongation factor [Opitutaceae bacterium]